MAATAPEPANDFASQAAAQLYERHARRVLAECSHRLRRREDAEEATQTTFLRAFGALRRGERPRSERAWLLTIARNVCTTNAERARKRGEVELEPELLDRVAAHVDVEVDVDVVDETLACALAALPEGQRRAIVLRACQGLSYAEIAQELGVTVAAVETWIFRARRTLAASLPERRRVLSFDFASLAAAFKSLAGGGGVAAKVALATVIAGATVGAVEVVERGVVDERAPVARRDTAVAPTSSRDRTSRAPDAPRLSTTRRGDAATSARPRAGDAAGAVTPATHDTTGAGAPSVREPRGAAARGTEVPAPQAVESKPAPAVAPPSVPPLVEEALPEVSLPPVEVRVPELPPVPQVPQLPVDAPPLPTSELPKLELPTLP